MHGVESPHRPKAGSLLLKRRGCLLMQMVHGESIWEMQKARQRQQASLFAGRPGGRHTCGILTRSTSSPNLAESVNCEGDRIMNRSEPQVRDL